VVKETAPNRAAQKHYDRAFPIYQQLYRSLKGDFKSIAELARV
jgi:xylulokinase